MWVLGRESYYINLAEVAVITTDFLTVENEWVANCRTTSGTVFAGFGSWSTQAEAVEAVREITQGLDPATFGD